VQRAGRSARAVRVGGFVERVVWNAQLTTQRTPHSPYHPARAPADAAACTLHAVHQPQFFALRLDSLRRSDSTSVLGRLKACACFASLPRCARCCAALTRPVRAGVEGVFFSQEALDATTASPRPTPQRKRASGCHNSVASTIEVSEANHERSSPDFEVRQGRRKQALVRQLTLHVGSVRKDGSDLGLGRKCSIGGGPFYRRNWHVATS